MKILKAETPKAAKAVPSPLGQTILMRSQIWQNGRRTVAAIVTGVDQVSEIELGAADYIVSATAFPPGLPSRMLQCVPLFAKEPGADVVPAAWPQK